ncbi:MAG: hypothetical protein AAGB26_03175 [Planctomycetota bacterium]
MTIKAQCSTCAAKFSVPDAAAGKSFICKQCGAKVRVPELEAASLPEPDIGAEFAVGFSHTPKKKPLPVLPMAIGGGVLLIVIIGVLVASMLGGGGATPKEDKQEVASAPDEPQTYARPSMPGDWQAQANESAPAGGERHAATHDAEQSHVAGSVGAPEQQVVDEAEAELRAALAAQAEGQRQANLDRENAERAERSSLEELRKAYPKSPVSAPILALKHEPVPPIGTWSAVPDPSMKRYRPSPSLELNINDRTIKDMVVPATPSPFIAIGDNNSKKRKRLIINTQTGEVVWDFTGDYPTATHAALSPDGLRVALLLEQDILNNQKLIFGFRGTNRRVTIDLDKMNGEPPKVGRRVHFINSTQAVVVEVIDQKMDKLTAYDTLKGDVLWQISGLNGSYRVDTCFAVSPDGKYIAVAGDGAAAINSITLINTETGELAGKLRAPDKVKLFNAIGFSPGGGRLLALMSNLEQLVAWDLTNGRTVSSVAISQESVNSFGGAGKLAVMGNGEFACLHGRVVIDAQTGLTFERFKNARYGTQRKSAYALTGTDFLAFSYERGGKYNRYVNVIRSEAFNLKQIQTVFVSLRANGEFSELGLPPLDETYYTQNTPLYKQRCFPLDMDALVAFPLAFEPRPLPDPTPGPITIPLPDRSGNPLDPIVTSSDHPRTVTMTNVNKKGQALMYLGPDRVYRFSPHHPRTPQRVALPGPMKPKWYSDDGSRALAVSGQHRVNLVNLRNNAVMQSWRIRRGKVNDSWPGRDRIVDAALVHGNRLWVRDELGQLSLIDTDTGKMLVSDRYSTIRLDQMTPDKRYLLALKSGYNTRGALRLVDTRTGVAVAVYDLGGSQASTASISPDGTRAAVLLSNKAYDELLVIDLQKNRVLHRNPLANVRDDKGRRIRSAYLRWVDPRFVIDGSHLIDTTTGRALWRFAETAVTPFRGVMDGQTLWGKRLGQGYTSLISTTLPTTQLLDQLATNPELQRPVPSIIGPGTTVRLQLTGVRHSKEIGDSLVRQIDGAGLVLSDPAQLTLVVSQQTRNTREEVVVSRGLVANPFASADGTITEYSETTFIKWLDSNGNVMWQDQKARHIGMHSGRVEGEDDRSVISAAQRDINKRLAEQGPRELSIVTQLPCYADDILVAEMVVSEAGFEPYQPPPPTNP